MNEEQLRAIEAYEKEAHSKESEAQSRYAQTYASLLESGEMKQNLIEWELDFTSELKDIERLLRCDILVVDDKGNERWGKNPDESKIFMNNAGVSDFLRQLRLLVNKNKVLSNYTIDEINKRVGMIGHEIRTLIYTNYEAYGIDNEYKMNNYSIVVLTIISIIEDAYRRALGGETHKALAEQRLVSQSQSLNGSQMMPMKNNSSANSHWYNPLSWGK